MGSLFSPPVVQAPTPAPPPTMPDPQSPDVLAAKQRAEQTAMGRAGRSSTILSTAVAGSGGGTYSASKLGSSN